MRYYGKFRVKTTTAMKYYRMFRALTIDNNDEILQDVQSLNN